MKSKTLISKQIKKKTNPELAETILLAKKNEEWLEVAGILASSRRNRKNMNLGEINALAKEGEIVVVPGKVLSEGKIEKKIKIVALNFSKKAEEKILKSKCEISKILEEIKRNPEAKGVKILK